MRLEAIVIVDEAWMMGRDGIEGAEKIIEFPPHNDFIQSKINGGIVCIGFNAYAERKFKPFDNCTTIVLAPAFVEKLKGAVCIHTVKELFDMYKNTDKTIYVMGGQITLRSLLPYIKRVYVTQVQKDLNGDIPCPRFRTMLNMERTSERRMYEDIPYTLQEYVQNYLS